MFNALSLPILLLIFAGAAAAVWVAGVKLSDTTDVLSKRLGLGQALAGLILLSIATNLPELAITVSAALGGNLGLAIGNILGGIAIQTVVLVVLDLFGVRGERSLSYQAASLVTVLEGILVAAVLAVAIIGTQLPAALIVARIAPGGLLIAVLWVVGLWLVDKARSDLPWQAQGDAPGGQESHGQARGHEAQHADNAENKNHADSADTKNHADSADNNEHSTARTALVFVAAAVITLVAGVLLEKSGDRLAGQIGLSGVLFGATVLAASTAIPELATGLTSVKLGDYRLAFSDIFGGNAFLPVLFLVASLLSGQAVLPQAQTTDIYLAGLGILLTTVYLYGLIFRPRRQVLGMGIDSLVVLILYALGIAGLFAVTHG